MAEPLHRLVVGHPRQRQRQLQAQNLAGQPGHQAVDHADDVLGVDERHFQVQLRELGLPVGPQVFVAEAAGNLHVAVVAGHHEDLLVELRRLRQGVKTALLHAAGHQVVAGPFRRAAAEHGRLDLDEPALVEIVAHELDDAVPQQQGLLHLRPPQVDVTVLQAEVFAGQVRGLPGWNGGGALRLRISSVAGADLDLARVELRVGGALGPLGHVAREPALTYSDRSDLACCKVSSPPSGREDDLRPAVAVAQIDEQLPAVVPIGVHPAAQRNLPADVESRGVLRRYESEARSVPPSTKSRGNAGSWAHSPRAPNNP